MRTHQRFAKNVESFVRQCPLQLGKYRVLLGIGMPSKTLEQRGKMRTEVRIGRMRGAEHAQQRKNARTFFGRELGTLLTP